MGRGELLICPRCPQSRLSTDEILHHLIADHLVSGPQAVREAKTARPAPAASDQAPKTTSRLTPQERGGGRREKQRLTEVSAGPGGLVRALNVLAEAGERRHTDVVGLAREILEELPSDIPGLSAMKLEGEDVAVWLPVVHAIETIREAVDYIILARRQTGADDDTWARGAEDTFRLNAEDVPAVAVDIEMKLARQAGCGSQCPRWSADHAVFPPAARLLAAADQTVRRGRVRRVLLGQIPPPARHPLWAASGVKSEESPWSSYALNLA